MRTKLLRRRDAVTVQLVYPSTFDEYRQALDALGGSLPASGSGDSPPAGCRPGHAAYVVTTAQQRHLWALPDLAVSGRAVPVDEARALDLLHDAAAEPDTAAELFPGRSPEVVSGLDAGGQGGSWFEAVRGFLSPGARIDRAVAALDGAGLPSPVHEALSDRLTQVFGSGAKVAEAELDRVRVVLDLPWAKSAPQRFDPAHVAQVLGRTHAALEGVKAGILRFLGSCPQARDLLTFEGPCSCRRAETDGLPALVVRPGPVQRRASVLCLAGPGGTGKTSLAHAIAEALGRTPVSVALDGKATRRRIRGSCRRSPGCVVKGLREAGVNNPVVLLEGIDEVGDEEEDTDALLGLLDSSKRTAFTDAYLDFPLDLSGVLWIATAAGTGAIPAAVRDCLYVVDLPAYTEQEKLAIAQEHLLTRPFDGPLPTLAGVLALEPVALGASVAAAQLSDPAAPVVVADQVVSVEELRALSAGAPVAGDRAGEPWRTAASRGDVRFEPEAVRRVIRDYTSEPGVKDLKARLADICRQVVLRRSPSARRPDIVTSSLVPEFLGDGSVDPLPLAVRAAIETERARLSDDSSSSSSRTSPWIEWLENLPWTRRNDAAVDLKRIRQVLDAGQAGLEDAKSRVIEYLAARKRNPRGTGAVLCFLGPPGTGKTSLAQSIAQALGRRYVRLPCGGLHDETDLRGHNRTWYRSQPGSILRELRRVGYRDPVVVLDEVDKVGPAPAAVLLEVLDPEQQSRFRDSFVELPFDLSEILFIATANEWTRIPPPLRDRLEVVELPGYTEAEKVAIAGTHLVPAENRAAGLAPTPVRITDGALRKIIRDYTCEPGVRQLTRCIKTICRKVALGRETGRPDAGPEARHGPGRQPAARRRHRRRRRARPSPPATRRPGHPGRGAGEGPSGLRAPVRVRVGVDRPGLHPFTGVPGVPRARAVELAHGREGRLGPGAGEAGREPCRPRRGEGTPPRSRRRACSPSRSAGFGALPDGPGGGWQDVAGPLSCRGPRARVRAGELQGAGGRRGVAGRPAWARPGSQGTAACRRQESGVRCRRARPAQRRRRPAGRGAGAVRLRSAHRLPRPLSRSSFRSVRRALRDGGDPSAARAVDVARTDHGGGGTGVHRGAEAGHRGRAPVAGGDPVERTVRRPCRGHRRGASVRDPRLRLGDRVVVSAGRARHVVPEGGAAPDRGRRVDGRSHAGDGRRGARRTDVHRGRRCGSGSAAGRRRRARVDAVRRRRAVHRGRPDARCRRTHPDGVAGRCDEGVGQSGRLLGPGERRAVRPRRGPSSGTPICTSTHRRPRRRRTAPRPGSPWWPRWCRRSPGVRFGPTWP